MRWNNYPKLLQLVNEKAVNNVVTVTEDPVVFKRLFQYFHTEDFPDRSSYTANEIINILKLASRNCPGELSDEMTKKLFENGLRLKNAYKMLNFASLFDLSGLKDMASSFMEKYVFN
ncbi:uncharacterized protein LOC118435795 [Folsomia candida]|uniref:uncharacterized protein LOC118435795 n=1 Tax=Folsomia candida TaxID=158441 RepID=UPI001604D7B1|nr:uncharacterized protein LOC118435795 [Folsomia candida]